MAVGIDSVEIERIAESIKNERFLIRVYGANELVELRDAGTKAQRAASSFAAKEAFSKAVGTGLCGFSLPEAELLHDENGKPYLHLSGKAKQLADKLKLTFEISITHTQDIATAIVIGWKR